MSQLPIYLDYMATTPVDRRVIESMMNYLGVDGIFGNPASSTHAYGRQAQAAVETARTQIADAVGASPDEIVFTSGATESDNLAIIGAARFYQRKGKHIITAETEHKAVLDSFKALAAEGFTVTYLKPNSEGQILTDTLLGAIQDDTILVSIMHVNNEIGVIQDIKTLGQICMDRGIIFHVDAAQSFGKLPIDLKHLPVHLMSFSAHKAYGPKGIGALFVRKEPRVRILPLSFGGAHERGMRSGTLPTHQIVGMGEAFAISAFEREAETQRLLKLRNKLWEGIASLPGVALNGSKEHRVAHNLNVRFAGIEGQTLQMALRRLAVSSTSACASSSGEASHVLQSIGLTREEAYSSIRMSLGRYTTENEIDEAIHTIQTEVLRLKTIVLRT